MASTARPPLEDSFQALALSAGVLPTQSLAGRLDFDCLTRIFGFALADEPDWTHKDRRYLDYGRKKFYRSKSRSSYAHVCRAWWHALPLALGMSIGSVETTKYAMEAIGSLRAKKIGKYVAELSIDAHGDFDTRREMFIAALLDECPNLRSLSLATARDFAWDDSEPFLGVLDAPWRRLLGLQSLTLIWWAIPRITTGHILDILSPFSQLDTLRLDVEASHARPFRYYEDPEPELVIPPNLLPKLHTLTIDFATLTLETVGLLEQIILVTHRTLRSLTLHQHGTSASDPGEHFFSTLLPSAPYLESLNIIAHFVLFHQTNKVGFYSAFDPFLSKCVKLRELRLGGKPFSDIPIFSTLASLPKLEEFAIPYGATHEQSSAAQLEEMAKFIRDAPSLKRVKIMFIEINRRLTNRLNVIARANKVELIVEEF